MLLTGNLDPQALKTQLSRTGNRALEILETNRGELKLHSSACCRKDHLNSCSALIQWHTL